MKEERREEEQEGIEMEGQLVPAWEKHEKDVNVEKHKIGEEEGIRMEGRLLPAWEK